jgi:hypothetical protein
MERKSMVESFLAKRLTGEPDKPGLFCNMEARIA